MDTLETYQSPAAFSSSELSNQLGGWRRVTWPGHGSIQDGGSSVVAWELGATEEGDRQIVILEGLHGR
jgi:hypothetical protein